jgi:ribonucleoside-diphosphate reductase alpha chain
MTKLQADLHAFAAYADRKNAEISAFIAGASPNGTLQSGLNTLLANMMGDAPACGECGSITVRNGTCYKCMNCGNSMGCS